MQKFKKFLYYLLFSFSIIAAYIELSHFWVSCGGLSGHIKDIELPIVFAVLLLFYFPSISLSKNIILSTLSVIALYAAFDVFYAFLARSPRFSDLMNAAVLSDFSPTMTFGVIMVCFAVLIPVFVFFSEYRTNRLWFIVKLIFIGLFYFIFSHNMLNKYIFKNFTFYNWSQARTIKKNGRISSFLYYTLQNRENRKKLALYKNKKLDVNALLFGEKILKYKPNIYIVVLESFIDPRLIKGADYSRSPLSDELKKYLPKGDFSHVISPVYGGGTSQAEFEVLTGVKALYKVSSIEFNVLDGMQIPGFTDLLKQNGYETCAFVATYSGYYNSKEAYKSIGFKKTFFLEEVDDFQKRAGDKKIFDGDLYGYVIRKLKNGSCKKPYLCYALGMYGHFPYTRNMQLRPDVIDTTYPDKRIKRIANQFYYRTKALAKYLDAILAFDPNSVIYVTSDHIPPLLTKSIQYKKEDNINIAMLLVNGKFVDVSGRHYYEIPGIIYRLINHENSHKKDIGNAEMDEIYFKTLSESIR